MWGLSAGSQTIRAIVDGVELSAPAARTADQLKKLHWARIPYRGNPNALESYIDRTLEEMSYTARLTRLDAKPTQFGENVLHVQMQAGGIRTLRMQGGVKREKKNTFLWASAGGAGLLIFGIGAPWIGGVLIAAGGALWFLTPTLTHYYYKPAALTAWVQGVGTAYKGTQSRKVPASVPTKEGQTVYTTYVESELELTAGVDAQVSEKAMDRFLLRDDEAAGYGVRGLLSAIIAGKKEVTVGSKEKYAQLPANVAALEKIAAEELKELKGRLARTAV